MIFKRVFLVATLLISACGQKNEAVRLVQEEIKKYGGIWEVRNSWVEDAGWEFNARNQNNNETYLVFYGPKEDGIAYFIWEADVKSHKVRFVNNNPFLRKKYGIFLGDSGSNFVLEEIESNKVSKSEDGGFTYHLVAKIKNNTKNIITSSEISGGFHVAFSEDNTVSDYGYIYPGNGFSETVSVENPWRPSQSRAFEFKGYISEKYSLYSPAYVFTELNLKAKNDIGFQYDDRAFEIEVEWPELEQ